MRTITENRRISLTELRQDIYNLIDEVISSGQPLRIERKGHLLTIVPESKGAKLDRLKEHDIILSDAEDLVQNDWSKNWSGANQL